MGKKIGIDVGGVIIVKDRHSTTEDTVIGKTPQFFPGAVETLAALVSAGHEVYIISFCGKSREQQTRQIFEDTKFFERTGIAPERLHFTRSRQAKAPKCKELGIEAMVDDTKQVHSFLRDIVPERLWFGHPEATDLIPVKDWTAVAQYFGV